MARNLHDPAGASPPLRERRPVRVGAPARYWIVCQSIEYAMVHWTGSRTAFCARSHETALCPWCLSGIRLDQEAWLLVQDWRPRQRPQLIKLTPGAVAHSRGLVGRDGDLWGRLIEVGREGNPTRGPMYCKLIDTADYPSLSEPVEVLPALKRLLGAPTKGAPRVGPGADAPA